MTIPAIEIEESRDQLDILELEVRRIPEIVSVSVSVKNGDNTLFVVAPSVENEGELRKTVSQLVRTYSDKSFAVTIDANIEKASKAQANFALQLDAEAESRPHLADLSTEDDKVTVRLEWAEKTGVGESSARTLNHAAEATLLAIEDLGIPVPFYVRSVTPLGSVLRDAVVVVLRANEAAEERFGVATGESAREATVRATLDALNRYMGYSEQSK